MDRTGMLDTWKSEGIYYPGEGGNVSTTPNRTKGLQKINSLMSYAEMKQFSVAMTKEQLTAVQANTAILC